MFKELFESIKALIKNISSRKVFHLKILLFVMLLSSLLELVTISLVLPFLSIILSPAEGIGVSPQTNFPFLESISTLNKQSTVISIVFIFFLLLSGAVRLLTYWAINYLSFSIGTDLSSKAFSNTLHQEYIDFISKNSSQTISGIMLKIDMVINGVLRPVLILINSLVIFVLVLITILLLNPIIAFVSAISLGGLYGITIFLLRKKMHKIGTVIAEESDNLIKKIQESLGAYRDIVLGGIHNEQIKNFKKSDASLRKSQAQHTLISQSPRVIIETAIISILVLVLAYLNSQNLELSSHLPFIGMLVFGMQKIMPYIQQAYGAFSEIKGYRASLRDVLNQVEIQNQDNLDVLDEKNKVFFKNMIEFDNISFAYDDRNQVFHSLNLQILKGQIIGLKGKTGAGKSTFLDILMGFLYPQTGSIKVDGVKLDQKNIHSYRKLISHVPQEIFLLDGTIRKNIILGSSSETPNQTLLNKAIKDSELEELILSLPQGLETQIGEKGIFLSGGQRQRIAIARALYNNKEILIFDEATSALDSQTELKILNTIYKISKSKTVIIVSHRVSTLNNCSRLFSIGDGKITELKK